MQNMTILASTDPEISLGPSNLKWVTWLWPRPFKGDLSFHCDLT